LLLVVLIHCGFDAVGAGFFRCISCPEDRCIRKGPFLHRKLGENEFVERNLARFADSDPETGDCFRAEMDEDGLQAVVAAAASRAADPEISDRERRVIADHEEFVRFDFVETGEVPGGLPAQIHERLRAHERTAAAARDRGIPLGLKLKIGCTPAGQLGNDFEADVVARTDIAFPRVAEPDNEPENWRMFHLRR
jgi:hypothetical protein